MIIGKDKIIVQNLKLEIATLRSQVDSLALSYLQLNNKYLEILNENRVLQAKVDSINEPSSELADVLSGLLKMSDDVCS